MTASEIIAALRARHSGHRCMQWAFFAEVRCGTGYNDSFRVHQFGSGRPAEKPDAVPAEQRIDALAVNCWPYRGKRAIAYEVKVSRSDFKHELERPEKRRFAELVSSECYFAAPAGLLSPDTIPGPWGLLEVTGGKLRMAKPAVMRPLEPWPYWFVVSLLRRVAREEL